MAIFPKFKKTLVCCLPFPHSLLLILFAFILPIFFCVSCDFLSFDHVMLFVWCFVFVSIPCYIPFSASLLLWTLRHFVDQDCYCKSENYLFILENFSLQTNSLLIPQLIHRCSSVARWQTILLKSKWVHKVSEFINFPPTSQLEGVNSTQVCRKDIAPLHINPGKEIQLQVSF